MKIIVTIDKNTGKIDVEPDTADAYRHVECDYFFYQSFEAMCVRGMELIKKWEAQSNEKNL